MLLRSALLLLVIALVACAVPAPPPPPPAAVDAATLRAGLEALPGAVVGEGLTVHYPGEALFAAGAALPLPGGTAVLDPLAELLLAHPGARGSAVVRAATGLSDDYDGLLAAKRAELLQRYLRSRGLPEGRLAFRSEAGDGAPLELTLEDPAQPASPASSSLEKR